MIKEEKLEKTVPLFTQNIYSFFTQSLQEKNIQYANPSWDFGNSRTIHFDFKPFGEIGFGGNIRYRFWAEGSSLQEEIDEVNDFNDEEYFNNQNIDFNKSIFIRANSELIINPKKENELTDFINKWNKENKNLRAVKRPGTALLVDYINLETLFTDSQDPQKIFTELYLKRMEEIKEFFCALYTKQLLFKSSDFIDNFESLGIIKYFRELKDNHIIFRTFMSKDNDEDYIEGKFLYSFATKERGVFFTLCHKEIKIKINLENFEEETFPVDEGTVNKLKDFFFRYKDL